MKITKKTPTMNNIFKEDTKDTCYLYYQNCAIEITKGSVKKISYPDLQGEAEKNVIPRDYDPIDFKDCVFERFVRLVSGGKPDSFRSVIGYLLHSCRMKTDKVIAFSDDGTGANGKGVVCQAIGHMKSIGIFDAQNFRFNDSFAFSYVTTDTKVLFFDDARKTFDIKTLVGLMSTDLRINRRGKDILTLPFHQTPKTVVISNDAIGESSARRVLNIKFSSSFNKNHTPHDEFGHLLFDEWSDEEWSKFDHYMVSCVQYYLALLPIWHGNK